MPFKQQITAVTTNTGFQYNNYKNMSYECSSPPSGTVRNVYTTAHHLDLICTNLRLSTDRNFADPGNTLGGLALSTNPIWTVQQLNAFDESLQVTATNASYSKLLGELRAGSAGLGVTLASYRQSADMIRLRAKQIRKLAKKAESRAEALNRMRSKRLAENRRARRRGGPRKWAPRDLIPVGSANVFLEGIFGWMPLYSSMKEAMEILASSPPFEVVGRSHTEFRILPKQNNHYGYSPGFTTETCLTTVRVKQSAEFRVTNPNAWLANQMGLVNPAVVAWDLVPWSFVVNMFVNVNSLMSQFTDFYGLEYRNASTTVRRDYHETSVFEKTLWVVYYMEDTRVFNNYTKVRTLGLSFPSIEFRLPKLTLSTAVMALSLAVQQISGLKYIKSLNAQRA